MGEPSITSNDSFRARAQRSESSRVALWLAILAVALAITLLRRWFGDVLMTAAQVFFPFVGVLGALIIGQAVLLAQVHRANRGGYLLPDWLWRGDGRLAVALGDVSGHGIGPALMMAACRAYARATTLSDAASFLTRLNELLHGDVPPGGFITFVSAVLDPDGGAQLISAGHGPTLLFRTSTGAITEFEGNGIPLAINPVEQYGPTTMLTLDEGDVLVMLTDGFFEWKSPGDEEQFGVQRLQEALRQRVDADAETILRALDQSICRFCDGSPQADDMTAIVIKRNAPAVPPLAAKANLWPGILAAHGDIDRISRSDDSGSVIPLGPNLTPPAHPTVWAACPP